MRGGTITYALFRSPEKGLHLRTHNRIFAPGLSIRGDGDWIPLPPSRFSGVEYFYEDPEEFVVVAPKFLANLMFLPSGQAEDGLPERFPPRQAKPDFFPASGKRAHGENQGTPSGMECQCTAEVEGGSTSRSCAGANEATGQSFSIITVPDNPAMGTFEG